MNTLVLDVAEQQRLFEELRQVLHAGGGWAHFVIDNPRKVSEKTGKPYQDAIWFPCNRPARIPSGKRKVYFTVNPCAAIPPTNAKGKEVPQQWRHSQNEYVSCLNCLYAEFDNKDFGGDDGATLDHIESIGEWGAPPPSVVTHSGGGYQCYWLLDATFHLDSEEARKRAFDAQAAWVPFVGGDEGVHDLRRILRVGGTWNVKEAYGPDGKLCHFVKHDLALRYSFDELEGLLPEPEPERVITYSHNTQYDDRVVSRYVDDRLDEEYQRLTRMVKGGRSAELVNSAMRLGSIYKADWSSGALGEQDIYRVLSQAAAQNGLVRDYGQGEVERQIGNGIRQSNPTLQPNLRKRYPELFEVATKPASRLVAPPVPPSPPPPTNGTLPPHDSPQDDPEPKKKKKHVTTAEYIAALKSLGYEFRMNGCNDVIEVNHAPISDALRAKIRTQMRDIGFGAIGPMEDAYTAHAFDNTYHPIKEYLEGLQWDGEDHIGELSCYFTDEHEAITYPDGTRRAVFHVWLLRWLVGAVAKVFDQKQNMMLVLDGPQETGKSSFVAWLAESMPDYFCEGAISPDDKDAHVRLMSAWIWEVAELGATTRKADREALKDFITKRMVTVRKSYGKHEITKPAMASLVGTINNESGFLSDPTGNRRFMVVTVTSIDWNYISVSVDQLWAQAVSLYRAGEPYRLTPPEKAMQVRLNGDYEMENPLDDFLRRHYDINPDGEGFTHTHIIIETLINAGWRADQKRLSMDLGALGKKLKLRKERRMVNGMQGMGYLGVTPITSLRAKPDDDKLEKSF